MAKEKAPISRDDMVRYLEEGCRPRADWRIGTEHEKLGFRLSDSSTWRYEGESSVSAILKALHQDGGGDLIKEGQHVVGILFPEDGSSITLEPGGQLELSGKQCVSIHETADELDGHFSRLARLAPQRDLGFLGVGFAPLWPVSAMCRVPKQRYKLLKPYLKNQGDKALQMMFQTCTAQVNLDYESEADMVKKLRTAIALQPIVTALFASSPFVEGKPSGYVSFRAHSWQHADPQRTGIIPFIFEEGFGFDRYVEYALSVPLFMIERGGLVHRVFGESFRDLLEGKLPSLPGARATLPDWENHLTTLYPEARIKRFMEMRGADVGNAALIAAMSALWTGLLYDRASLEDAYAIIKDWSAEDRDYLYRGCCRDGFRLPFRSQTVRDLAQSCVEIAAKGLKARNVKNSSGEDEAIFLEPLFEMTESGKTPADDLLEKYHGAWKGDVTNIFKDPNYRLV